MYNSYIENTSRNLPNFEFKISMYDTHQTELSMNIIFLDSK